MNGYCDTQTGKWVSLPDRPVTGPVTVDNFGAATDDQLRAAARARLASVDPKRLKPRFRKMLKSDRVPIEEVGTFLWATLCNWKTSGLSSAIRRAA